MAKISNDKGAFVISLDFELLWGVWDVTTKEKYGNHIKGVKEVIPGLLELFSRYDFKATFAVVGFLFAEDKQELLDFLPETKPAYSQDRYNVYLQELNEIGQNDIDDPYHFGYSLLELIKKSEHEIATHTFSHYYCLEEGQTLDDFNTDIESVIKVASAKNINLTSLVFPRNQLNLDYLSVLKENKLNVYRGNPDSWIYKPRKFAAELPFIRICRLLDTYLPVSGYNTHSLNSNGTLPVNIPASRFLKPFNKKLAWLEKLKLKRIMNEMTRAAQKKELYHLWWHPHNFGININENMANLTVLLDHYLLLQKKYGFTNLTMKEAAGF
jgi:peptidoglycan/xylan/chitin deacetylase (PgdA/CDA1 family)